MRRTFDSLRRCAFNLYERSLRKRPLQISAALAVLSFSLFLVSPAGSTETRYVKLISVTTTQTSATFEFTDMGAVGTVTYNYSDACAGTTTAASGVAVTVTCSNLTPTTKYVLLVTATDSSGAVTATAALIGLTVADNPVVTKTSASPTSLTLSVTSNPLYAGTPQNFTYSYAGPCNGKITAETGQVVSFTCSSLTPAKGYQFNVDATSATGVEQGLTELVAYTTPAAPSATVTSTTSSSLTWTLADQAGTENAATTVTYYYSGACSGSVNDHGTGTASVICSGLTSGETYSLSVYAVAAAAGTSPTTTATGTTGPTFTSVAPSVPVIVSKNSTNQRATITFDSISGTGTITYHYSGSCSGTVTGLAGQAVSVTCKVAKPKSVTIDVLATNAVGSSPNVIAFVAR